MPSSPQLHWRPLVRLLGLPAPSSPSCSERRFGVSALCVAVCVCFGRPLPGGLHGTLVVEARDPSGKRVCVYVHVCVYAYVYVYVCVDV